MWKWCLKLGVHSFLKNKYVNFKILTMEEINRFDFFRDWLYFLFQGYEDLSRYYTGKCHETHKGSVIFCEIWLFAF